MFICIYIYIYCYIGIMFGLYRDFYLIYGEEKG